MLYQKQEPYVVAGDEFAERFDFRPTPMGEGVRQTIAWYEASRIRQPLVAERGR